MRKGKKVRSENLELEENVLINDFGEAEMYKYLGIEENAGIEHKRMRESVGKEYLKRTKRICKTQLTNKNKIVAINQLAVPVLNYSFGVVDWPQNEIDKLDVKTRKILTLHKITYRNQCLDRIYLPRKKGGLGLTEINHAHRAAIVSLGQYLTSSINEKTKLIKKHQDRLSQQTSITKLAENFGMNCLENVEENENLKATKIARRARTRYTKRDQELKENKWESHDRAKKFPEEIKKN